MSNAEPLSDVVGAGVRLDSLKALRDVLARRLDHAEPRESASLAKQLRDTLAEIAELEPDTKGSKRDELAAKRAARRSKAASQ